LTTHERSCYYGDVMSARGRRTRQAILDEALQLASVVGLEGLTIGTLADRLGLSKSGLYAHFRSKDALQHAILETGVEHYTQLVIAPALEETRGVAQLKALFRGWLDWSEHRMAGGCLFLTAIVEFDDRPGTVRDFLSSMQQRWTGLLTRTADEAVATGELRPELDTAQLAFEFNAILWQYNQARRLLRDPEAEHRAWRAFERLLQDARPRSTRA
jgi:AcrR family transcriptional regulator